MPAGRRGDRVALTIGPRQLRGGVASCGSSPARPTRGGSRSIERGCTGRAGRCSRPRRKFGFRRRRAPSVRRRRRVCHCVSAQPCLDCSPTQAGQTLLGLAIPRRSGSLGSRQVGCRPLGPPLLWCWSIRMGWAGWAWPQGLGPSGADAWSAAGPAQIGGQVAGCRGPREPARSAAADPGPGGRLDAGELCAWVGGSSVSLTCSCTDQGGCHVDMVVGADHRGRSCGAVWSAAGPPSPLTRCATSRITAGASARPGRRPGGVAVRPGPAGTADAQRCPARRARVRSRGWGHPGAVTATSSLLEGRVVRLRAATPSRVRPARTNMARTWGGGRPPASLASRQRPRQQGSGRHRAGKGTLTSDRSTWRRPHGRRIAPGGEDDGS